MVELKELSLGAVQMYKYKKILAGTKNKILISREKVFSNIVIDFLDDLSKIISSQKNNEPEITSFGFWCRKKNIILIKDKFNELDNNFGRGLGIHIAPSNVPTAFAFSLAFGMLSGNSNIIKVSSKENFITNKICFFFDKIFKKKKYNLLKFKNQIVSIDSNINTLEEIYKICDFRLIWGSDHTISKIKSFKTKPDCVDLIFSDRYSISIINAQSIDKKKLINLVSDFYNDTMLMDQNACTSPKIIFWRYYDKQKIHLFWKEFSKLIKLKYEFDFNKSYLKKNFLENACINYSKSIKIIKNYNNAINVITLKKLPKKNQLFSNKFGNFFEFYAKDFKFLKKMNPEKLQSVSYYGIKKNVFLDIINLNPALNTMRRIVPIGRTLELDLYWDGYNIIEFLSKKIIIK